MTRLRKIRGRKTRLQHHRRPRTNQRQANKHRDHQRPLRGSHQERAAHGISEGLVRISAGLEDTADLLQDVAQALAVA